MQDRSTDKFQSRSCKRLAMYAALVFSTILLSVLASVFSTLWLTRDCRNNSNPNALNATPQSHTALKEYTTYTREQWGGGKPLNFTRSLHHPTEYVIISHTAGAFCQDFLICAKLIRAIQSLHMADQMSPDIGMNFLIGGDGDLYIGRGWDIRNFHQDNNIGISFMGNYIFDELTPKMISTVTHVLEEGVKLKKLSQDYKLVCHNQTFATLSPGQNVYRIISSFPNFFPGKVNE